VEKLQSLTFQQLFAEKYPEVVVPVARQAVRQRLLGVEAQQPSQLPPQQRQELVVPHQPPRRKEHLPGKQQQQLQLQLGRKLNGKQNQK